MSRGTQIRNLALTLLSLALLVWTAIETAGMIRRARKVQEMKTDLAELRHIRHGLLNPGEWTDRVTLIAGKKILEFDLEPENREELQRSVESILHDLLDDLEGIIDDRTSGQFAGMKKFLATLVVDTEQLRDSVPAFAESVLDGLNRPATRQALRTYLNDKLEELSDQTYGIDSIQGMEPLMEKYGFENPEQSRQELQIRIQAGEGRINGQVVRILVRILLIFLLLGLTPGTSGQPDRITRHARAPLLIGASLCLLAGGIATPMIDLEARIDRLSFLLIGEEMIFRDNVIFFQSKSITDIVQILLQDGALEMIFVGILIFAFSIVFPVTKLATSYVYSLHPEQFHHNRVIRFFVVKSGKWSMADVMVVAIFMAYIGFNGIVGNQLEELKESSKPVEIFTTNGTHLLGGFYLFLGFCISSLVLSEIIAPSHSSNT